MSMSDGSQNHSRETGSVAIGSGATSHLLPTFVAQLADPSIRTVLLCGCGGGFDFVHSLTLYPELRRLGKTVVIGSYSFGDPMEISGAVPVFAEDEAIAVRVTADNLAASDYGPEVHICSYLDAAYPDLAPHSVYAYYARAFTVPSLTRLYRQFIDAHSVDAIVLVDGGSDSLMVGDEEGLGDPIEDAVSVARRSLIGSWIRDCHTVRDCHDEFHKGRRNLGTKLRDVENFPRHEEMRYKR